MGVFVYELPFSARLIIETDPTSAVARIEHMCDKFENMEPLLNQLAAIMRQDLGRAFSEGGPGWKPLAASTVAAKMGMGLPARSKKGRMFYRLKQNGNYDATNILIATGALRDSYRRKGAKGHVEQIDTANCSVMVGSNLRTPDGKYSLAAIHQDGTKAYTIMPRNKKALAFGGSSGETLLRKIVRHPGLAARPVSISDDAVSTMRLTITRWFLTDSRQVEVVTDAA